MWRTDSRREVAKPEHLGEHPSSASISGEVCGGLVAFAKKLLMALCLGGRWRKLWLSPTFLNECRRQGVSFEQGWLAVTFWQSLAS